MELKRIRKLFGSLENARRANLSKPQLVLSSGMFGLYRTQSETNTIYIYVCVRWGPPGPVISSRGKNEKSFTKKEVHLSQLP